MAELTVINPFDFFLENDALSFPVKYAEWLDTELAPTASAIRQGPRFDEFLASVPRTNTGTVDFLVDLNRYVHGAIKLCNSHGSRRANLRGNTANWPAARAATRPGCSCKCSAIWAFPPALSPAT